MDAMIPSPAGGDQFNFNSTCTSPHMIGFPTSPQRFGNYLVSDQIASDHREQKDDTTEFTFNFSGVKLEDSHFICADELFHGGKIKPLKLVPLSQYRHFSAKDSPKTPRSPKRIITMSPRQKNKDSDPLLKKENKRSGSKSFTLNVSSMVSQRAKIERSSRETSTSSWYGKWKLTDILLFRSASEGHATIRSGDKEDLKNVSFRSADSRRSGSGSRAAKEDLSLRSADGSGSGSSGGSRRMKGLVSAHEWHYKNKRAAAEEMRRKTFLPYKKNLLGCMDLDPGVREFSKGLTLEIKC